MLSQANGKKHTEKKNGGTINEVVSYIVTFVTFEEVALEITMAEQRKSLRNAPNDDNISDVSLINHSDLKET